MRRWGVVFNSLLRQGTRWAGHKSITGSFSNNSTSFYPKHVDRLFLKQNMKQATKVQHHKGFVICACYVELDKLTIMSHPLINISTFFSHMIVNTLLKKQFWWGVLNCKSFFCLEYSILLNKWNVTWYLTLSSALSVHSAFCSDRHK